MVDGFIDDAYELRVEKLSAAGEMSSRSISLFVLKPSWYPVFLRCSPLPLGLGETLLHGLTVPLLQLPCVKNSCRYGAI